MASLAKHLCILYNGGGKLGSCLPSEQEVLISKPAGYAGFRSVINIVAGPPCLFPSTTDVRLFPSRHSSVPEGLFRLFRQRFSHLQHGMVILFVCELTRNLPPLTQIELHGKHIRSNDTKVAGPVTTSSDLSFTLRQ
jgi:hypothetical protein